MFYVNLLGITKEQHVDKKKKDKEEGIRVYQFNIFSNHKEENEKNKRTKEMERESENN